MASKTPNVFSLLQIDNKCLPVIINRKDFKTNILVNAAFQEIGNLRNCSPSLNGHYLTIPIEQEFNENQTRIVYYSINLHDPSKNEKTLLYSPWISIDRKGIFCYFSQQHFLAVASSNQGSLSLHSHMDGTVIWKQEIGRNTLGEVRTIQDNYVAMRDVVLTRRLRVFCLKTGNLISYLSTGLNEINGVQISGHRIALLLAKFFPRGFWRLFQTVAVFDIKTFKQLLCSESDLKLRSIETFKLESDRIILYQNYDARIYTVKFGV